MRWLALLACVVVPWTSVARAQTDALAGAEAALAEGELERAGELLLSVTHDPARDPSDVAHAYELLGVVHATLGEQAEAERAFDWALALDPGMPTPAELGPTQRQWLDPIRARRHGHAIAVVIETPPEDATGAATIRAHVEGAPEGATVLVTLVVWPDDDEAQALSATAGGATNVTVPAGAWPHASEIHVRAEATRAASPTDSPSGPVLAHREQRLHRAAAPADATPFVAAAPTPASGGSVIDEPWFWIVIGVVAAGAIAGLVVGLTLPQQTTIGPPQLADHLP